MVNRATVKRIRIGAQVGAFVMALALAAVIVAGAPSGAGVGHERVAIEPTLAGGDEGGEAPSGPAPDQARVDFAGIAHRLEMLKDPPPEPKKPEGGDDQDPEGGATTPQSSGGEIKYLGMITVGLSRSALLSVDGVQRVVAQGASIDNAGERVRVSSVQADYVVLVEGRNRRRVDKAGRATASVTTIDPSAVAPKTTTTGRPAQTAASAAAGGDDSSPRQDFERRRQEAIQKALAEGRIDEEQARSMLDRIERMREERERDNDR